MSKLIRRTVKKRGTALIVGGLAFSQIVTLYVTPIFYTYLDALQRRLRRSRAGSSERAPALEPRRIQPKSGAAAR